MEHYKLLNDSDISKFLTNKRIEENDYQVINIPPTRT